MTGTSLSAPPIAATARPFVPARLAIATSVAIVVNVALFLAGLALGASMVITQPAESQLNVGVVIAATLVPMAIAGAVVWLLARRWPVVRTVAAWAGLGLALASSLSPLLVSGDLATGLALGGMHVAAGIAWFVGVRKPRA
jgi:hypothetical protein